MSGFFAPTGRRVVATGGAKLASAERNPWKNLCHHRPGRGEGIRRSRVIAHAHGLRSGSLRIACASPVATFRGPIRGHPGPGPNDTKLI